MSERKESRREVVALETGDSVCRAPRRSGGATVTVHRLVVSHVERTESGGYRAIFGCSCGDYTAEETALTQADGSHSPPTRCASTRRR